MSIKLKASIYTVLIIISWPLLVVVGAFINKLALVIAMFLPIIIAILVLLFMTIYESVHSILMDKEDLQ